MSKWIQTSFGSFLLRDINFSLSRNLIKQGFFLLESVDKLIFDGLKADKITTNINSSSRF